MIFACDIVLRGDCDGVGNDPLAAPSDLVGVTDCGCIGGAVEPRVLVFRIVEDGLFGLPGTKFGTAATCEAVVVAAGVTFISD